MIYFEWMPFRKNMRNSDRRQTFNFNFKVKDKK